MIDPLSSDLISINEAAKLVPRRCHRHSIFRWMRDGRHGHLLESVLVAGHRYTTRDALREFLQAIQHAPGKTPPEPVTNRGGRAAKKRVEKLLAN